MDLKNALTTFAGFKKLPPNSKPTLFSLHRLHFFASLLIVRQSHARVLEGLCQARGGEKEFAWVPVTSGIPGSSAVTAHQQDHQKSHGFKVFKTSSPHQAPSSFINSTVQGQPHSLFRVCISASQDLPLSSFPVDFSPSLQGSDQRCSSRDAPPVDFGGLVYPFQQLTTL